MHNMCMDETISGSIPAINQETVSYHDMSGTDQKIAELQIRLSSLEEDFSKLTAFVNTINSKIK